MQHGLHLFEVLVKAPWAKLCESLLKDGVWQPIDFANPCPDSQVTSLHVHFPWLIKAKLRWSLFCAATRRPMRINLDWQPYYDVAEQDLPYREKVGKYAAIAREYFQTAAFEAFLENLAQSCLRRRVDYVTWMTDLAFEKMFLDLLSRGSALSQG